MGVLADWQIEERVFLPESDPLHMRIDPFEREQISRVGVVSFGLGSYGYDIRLGKRYFIFSDVMGMVIDPLTVAMELKARKERGEFIEHVGDDCLVPPNSFALAESLEHVRIPEDVIALVSGKSTYARCAVNLNMTPLEPGWRGVITIEIANMSRLPVRVHTNQGIGQVLFLKGDAQCRVPYNKKKNPRYQDQKGLLEAKTT